MPGRRTRRAMIAGAVVANSRSKQAAQASPVATPQTGLTPDITQQLTDLKGLLDSGILTQEEFDAKKTQILAL